MRAAVAAVSIVAFALVAWGQGADPPPDDAEYVRQGKALYAVYCRDCHGERGRGDGPTAEVLRIKPADLTLLSRSNRGSFPFDRVFESIDGRRDVRAHGSRQMPIWGIALQQWDSDADQSAEVAGRILLLTYYVRSIQLEPAGAPE